jgi:hypothetical protein
LDTNFTQPTNTTAAPQVPFIVQYFSSAAACPFDRAGEDDDDADDAADHDVSSVVSD